MPALLDALHGLNGSRTGGVLAATTPLGDGRPLNREQKKLQKSIYNRRTPEEQKRLNRRSRLRKGAQGGKGKRSRAFDPDDLEVGGFEKIRRGSPDAAPKGRRGGTATGAGAQAVPVVVNGREGRVISLFRGGCVLDEDGRSWRAVLDRGTADAVVGDLLLFQPLPDYEARARAILPRRTTLSRPDPRNPNHREHVLAANVDLAVIVVSVLAPPLHSRLIDRFLVAAQHGGMGVALCLNKSDLIADDDEAGRIEKILAPYRELGLAVVYCSAATGEGVERLREQIAGSTCVLVGHSGVGKSCLLNSLDPNEDRRTGGLRLADGKGRHTTTSVDVYDLPLDTKVIDTPGIREMGLWQIGPDVLGDYFPEFAEPSASCKFRDCRHDVEPSCGVKRAVEEGAIPGARYEAYLRLLASV